MGLRSPIKRTFALLAPAVAALALLSASPPKAEALYFNWNCNFGNLAYSQCVSGSFHSWVTVVASYGDTLPSDYNGFCVKAVTEAGNLKMGSRCFPYNDFFDGITIAASPTSEGYYYFGGSGVSYNNGGAEST